MNVINIDKNGNDITTRVFKNADGKYSIAISKKIEDKYDKRYFPVEFLKGVELENETDIIIKHAYLTWFDWEFDGKKGTKFVIKIAAFDKTGTEQPVLRPEPKIDKVNSAKDIVIDDDSLPFY